MRNLHQIFSHCYACFYPSGFGRCEIWVCRGPSQTSSKVVDGQLWDVLGGSEWDFDSGFDYNWKKSAPAVEPSHDYLHSEVTKVETGNIAVHDVLGRDIGRNSSDCVHHVEGCRLDGDV